MSVEEARAAVLERLRASDYTDWSKGWDGPYGDLKDEPLLDRLILEVKASMPCGGAVIKGMRQDTDVFDCTEHGSTTPCPSCEAREQLKAPV